MKRPSRMKDSMILVAVALALFYWVLESFLYFFYEPDVNFVRHLLGPDVFEIWTRLLVLCLFVIFGSHVQYTINKRKASELELSDSERRYKTIVDSIEEGYFENDLAGNFTFFNDSLAKILGYSREELMGMNNRSYSDSKTAKRMFVIFNGIYKSGESRLITNYEIFNKSGEVRVVELSTYLVRDRNGVPTGFRGIVRDVSERHFAEREKHKLAASLQQVKKMEAVGTLASGIAHDFNNILMGMMGNLDQMLSNVDKQDPFYEKLNKLEQYIENGTGLTRQLLGFARGGKSKTEIADINEIVEMTSRMFGRTKTSIRIHVTRQFRLHNVRVDVGQLEQVLLNLYVNAWHAMPDGGELYLQTENVEIKDGDIKPFKTAPGVFVKISVTDTGVGIEKELQNRIFEPFFTTKDIGSGTGLGLSTAYRILERHNGGITVYSEPGKGTTFNLYLPASMDGKRAESPVSEQ